MTTRQALIEIERLAKEEIAPADTRAAATIIVAVLAVRFGLAQEGEPVLAQGPARLAENYGRRDR